MTTVTLGSWMIELSAVLATVGPVLYAVHPRTRRTWYRDDVGVHLMVYMVVIAAVMDLSTIAIIFHATRQDDWFAWLRLSIFAGMPVVLGWRDIIIFRGGSRRKKK